MGSITHAFTSPKADGGDNTLVQPSNWNAGHTFSLAASDLSNGVSGSGSVALATSPTLTTPIIGSYTFATLPSAASNSGAMARVTDIGPTTAGSYWVSNGTIWKPLNGRVQIVTGASGNVAGGGVATILMQFQFPAAFFNVGDRIRMYANTSKGGTTTTLILRGYMGSAGTTSDAQIIPSITNLTAASQSGGAIMDFTIASATQSQFQGGVSQATGSYTASASAAPAAVTIPNVSGSLYVSLGVLPGATDQCNLTAGVMEYYSA